MRDHARSRNGTHGDEVFLVWKAGPKPVDARAANGPFDGAGLAVRLWGRRPLAPGAR